MNKLLFFIILTGFTSCGRGTQHKTQAQEPNLKNVGVTQFEFKEEIHNFGVLQAGEIAVYDFSLENTGEDYLIIKSIDKGCGCLEVKTDKAVYPPGSMGLVEVTFDTSGLFGKQFKMIKLYVNTQEGTKELAVVAEVKNNDIIKYKQ
ncbi:MAG: DUF1573 domain-containing protein [Chlorobi bacterium]|nr:DUF1573 domain-containing protein [Chlorobiota bacterium]